MKILVVQLARLGDIYQTWPVLRALKRMNEGAEIHLMTRTKFAAAAPGAPIVDKHWLLDTREILSPLIDERPDIDQSQAKLVAFSDALRAEKFDRVINLSFSPFSSFLVREISAQSPHCQVSGYTRFSDGYLSIPDDGSAYFYAQVGSHRGNRVHLTDLFAYVAGIQIAESDWEPPAIDAVSASSSRVREAGENAIVVHVGASDLGKTLSWSKWMQIVKGLLASHQGPVVLIGSSDEAEWAEKISAVSTQKKPLNFVGQTDLKEVFEIVRNAKLLIGADSAPVQMASLTNTPVLNLSLPMVCFWETGPRSKGSHILPIVDEGAISAEEIVTEAIAMLSGRSAGLPVIRVAGPTFSYMETRPQPLSFEWELMRGLYMEETFPPPTNETFLLGARRLEDVNLLAIEQIEALKRLPTNKTASAILDRVNEIMEQIVRMVPEIGPAVRWFQTERLRIGPMPVNELLNATENVHRRFADVIALYSTDSGAANDDVVLG